MPLPDYYRILGLSRTARPHEIKAAYRRLARRHHPDLHPDDPHAEETLKTINQAYSVLSDVAQRRQYDAQTAPLVSVAYAPPRPATVRRTAAPRRPARDPRASLKVLIKAVFVLGLISLLAALAYLVLFQ